MCKIVCLILPFPDRHKPLMMYNALNEYSGWEQLVSESESLLRVGSNLHADRKVYRHTDRLLIDRRADQLTEKLLYHKA